jgi:hypothetical protein
MTVSLKTLVSPQGPVTGITVHGTLTGLSNDDHPQYNVIIKDEGTSKTTKVDTIDFVGAGVTATNSGDVVTVTIPGGGVTAHNALTGLAADDHTQYHTDARGDAKYTITVKDEGSDLSTTARSIDFVGQGVTATNSGNNVTVTIPGTSLGGIDGGSASTPLGSYTLRMDFGSAT